MSAEEDKSPDHADRLASIQQLVSMRANLLKRQSRLVMELDETSRALVQVTSELSAIATQHDILDRLNMSTHQLQVLRAAGISTLADLTKCSRTTLRGIIGIRGSTVRCVERTLEAIGLSLQRDIGASTPLEELDETDPNLPRRLRWFAQEHGLMTIGALVGYCYTKHAFSKLGLSLRTKWGNYTRHVEALCYRAYIDNPSDYRPRPKIPAEQTISSIQEVLNTKESDSGLDMAVAS